MSRLKLKRSCLKRETSSSEHKIFSLKQKTPRLKLERSCLKREMSSSEHETSRLELETSITELQHPRFELQ